jgi:hypothetical protein
MMLNLGMNNLWSTPVYKGKFEVNPDIVLSAMNKEVHHKVHDLAETHFDQYLNETLGIALSDYKDHKLLSWVNRYENTEMEYHTHNGAHLSAVYYPIVEGSGGEIVFYDPRFFAARGYDMNFRRLHGSYELKPEAGDFIIFPSYLYHSVRVSAGFKLSIPVDLFLYSDS